MDLPFKDTIHTFVLDSAIHRLGKINPDSADRKVIKRFKYIGEEPDVIVRIWTGDPHFICEHPKEPLFKDSIYSFTVCFHHKGKRGKMRKRMGFKLMNDVLIPIIFEGEYVE